MRKGEQTLAPWNIFWVENVYIINGLCTDAEKLMHLLQGA